MERENHRELMEIGEN